MPNTVTVSVELPEDLRCVHRDCEAGRHQGASLISWLDGRAGDALAEARQALHAHREDCCAAHSASWLAMLLTTLHEFDAALEALTHAAPSDSCHGSAPVDLLRRVVLAHTQTGSGFPSALEALRTAVDGRIPDLPEYWQFYVKIALAAGALRCSDLDTLSSHTREIVEECVLAPVHLNPIGWGAWLIAKNLAAEHGGQAALHSARRLAATGPACRRLIMVDPPVGAWLAQCLLEAGDYSTAVTLLSAAREVVVRAEDVPVLRAGLLHIQGVVLGRPEDLRQAAALYPSPWAVAAAFEDLAGLATRHGASANETVPRLLDALKGYERAGTPSDAARVRQRLRDLGHRAHCAPAPHTGDGSRTRLTRAERSVAELVAQGLTNAQVAERLFLSQHTVAFHLRTIFRKLGLKSRVELARRWERPGTASPAPS